MDTDRILFWGYMLSHNFLDIGVLPGTGPPYVDVSILADTDGPFRPEVECHRFRSTSAKNQQGLFGSRRPDGNGAVHSCRSEPGAVLSVLDPRGTARRDVRESCQYAPRSRFIQ